MYDTVDKYSSIFGITNYTDNVSYYVKKYIDFCKFIMNNRPLYMLHDIIYVISLAWTIDIVPFNQVYGDYFPMSSILSGTEKFEFKHKQNITHELALEIIQYVLHFRNEGFVYNKNKQQLEFERNEIAVMHNKQIGIWKRYSKSNSQMSISYKNWIHCEEKLRHTDWTHRSINIRHGEFVAKMEYYFKNHLPVCV